MLIGRPPTVPINPDGPHTLRWYQNRRCYDPRTKRYVNLGDVLLLAAADRELRIIDATTGEDVTARVLLAALRDVPERVPLAILRALCAEAGR